MAILWLKRVGNALYPDATDSNAEFEKLPVGVLLRCEIKQPRNIAHHRLFFALCHRIADAVGAEPENISDLLKIETGHCYIVHSKKYGQLRLPKSISFAKMDNQQFRDFFELAVKIIYENWSVERADILDLVGDLLEPKTERRA